MTIEQRIQVRQAEAQMLREAGDDAGAYAVLAKGLDGVSRRRPTSSTTWRWSPRSSTSVDEAEKRARSSVVALKPDDAQALNALGYTLVDRTTAHRRKASS